MSQERTHRHDDDGEEEDGEAQPAGQERREKLDTDVGDVLDDIDEVLEENAEHFVNAYIQKGGQ